MAIDTTQPQSPGWWVQRLSAKLVRRQIPLNLLDSYMRGEPPIDLETPQTRQVFRAFMRKARTNFAELVVEAPRERMAVQGFRTSAASDDEGDEDAWAIWKACGLELESRDVHEQMLGLGLGYVIVGPGAVPGAMPIITGEDPRQVITEHDPTNRQKVIAGLKLFHDDVNDVDMIYLYLPGKVYTASRPRRAQLNSTGQPVAALNFSASAFSWVSSELVVLDGLAAGLDPDEFDAIAAQSLPVGMEDLVPVVPFANKHELGEFETHRDLLDRINHTILQRMVIATFQAFRQRAVRGELPDTNEAGEQIDYDKIFSADPGSLWLIPGAVEMWESGQVDLTPILGSISADIEQLAAVTRTPIHYLTPGETAQSAEGASLAREGLVFKTEDRIARANVGWTQVMSLAFLYQSDPDRADVAQLEPIWGPVERYSLQERAVAASQAVTSLPWETLMEYVWGLSPEQLARAKSQRTIDMVIAQVAMQTAAANAKLPVTDPAADGPVGGQ